MSTWPTWSRMRPRAPTSAQSALNPATPRSPATRSRRSRLRAMITTRSPAARKCRALASPMPLDPPVISTVRGGRAVSSAFLSGLLLHGRPPETARAGHELIGGIQRAVGDPLQVAGTRPVDVRVDIYHQFCQAERLSGQGHQPRGEFRDAGVELVRGNDLVH